MNYLFWAGLFIPWGNKVTPHELKSFGLAPNFCKGAFHFWIEYGFNLACLNKTKRCEISMWKQDEINKDTLLILFYSALSNWDIDNY